MWLDDLDGRAARASESWHSFLKHIAVDPSGGVVHRRGWSGGLNLSKAVL